MTRSTTSGNAVAELLDFVAANPAPLTSGMDLDYVGPIIAGTSGFGKVPAVYKAELVSIAPGVDDVIRRFEQRPNFPRMTEMGLRDWFAKHFRGSFLYCVEQGLWYSYDRGRYHPDHKNAKINGAISLVVTALNMAAGSAPDSHPFRDARVKYARGLEARAQRTGLRSDLEGHPEFSVCAHELDPLPDPSLSLSPVERAAREAAVWQINTPTSGVFDFRLGRYLPHSPAYRHTKALAVDYVHDAPNDPDFEFVLKTMFSHLKQEDVDALFEILGTALLGEAFLKLMLTFVGDGFNLKSTFLNIIAAVLGGYAGSIEPEVLIARKNGGGGSAHTDWLRGFLKTRFVVVQELPANAPIDVPLLKRLTGGDPMRFAGKGEDGYDFRSAATIATGSNAPPEMSVAEAAAWERIGLIFLPGRVAPGTDNPEYKTLLARRESVQRHALRLLFEGALRFVKTRRVKLPEVFAQARDEERSEQNPLAEFVDEVLEFGPDYTLAMPMVEDCARCWNVARRARIPTNPQKLAAILRAEYKDRGLTDRDEKGVRLRTSTSEGKARYWKGARLVVEWGREQGGEFVRPLTNGMTPGRRDS